jgi:hypothetical protein
MADTVIRIGGDTRELTAAYRKAERETVSFGGRVSGTLKSSFAGIGSSIAGAFAVGAIGNQISKTLSHFDAVQDMADRLNTTAEQIQKLDIIGQASGTDAEGLVDALSRVTRALGDVDNASARRAFQRLGVDMEKLAQAAPVDQILILSQAFQAAQAKGQGFTEIYDLLGKSAGNLIPLLRASRGELVKLSNTPVLPDGQVKQLADASDQITLMGQQATIASGAVLTFLGKLVAVNHEWINIQTKGGAAFFGTLFKTGNLEQATGAWARKVLEVHGRYAEVAEEAGKVKNPIVTPAAQSAKETQQQNDRIGAARTLQEEIALLAAKATGSQKIIDNVTREIELNRNVAKLMKEQGVSKADALAVAKQMQALEDQAERKSNRAKGIPNKIKGGVSSSAKPGSLAEFYADQDKPITTATPGLDRFKELQRRPKGLDFNRRIPIGKGFEGTTGTDPLAAQAAKAADESRRNDGGNASSLESLLKAIADNTQGLRDLN